MRLEKVGLNKYLNRINLSPTDICTNCNSGEVEDITHYFFSCQKYTNERARLFNFLTNIGYNQITLKELLGGAEGDPETLQILINSQVALFIKKTKRFEI